MKRFALVLTLMVALSGLTALPLAAQEDPANPANINTAHAIMIDVSGAQIGEVVFEQFEEGVIVSVFVQNLTPGFHGFHIHETGTCDPNAEMPFSTAGGHFNPAGTSHGDHAGDMPSLLVTGDGRAFLSFITDRFDLSELFDADGSAVMIHSDRDNFANIPERYTTAPDVTGPDEETLRTGDAGSRMACGVVEQGLGAVDTPPEDMVGTAEPVQVTPVDAAPTASPEGTMEPTMEPTEDMTMEPTMEPTAEVTMEPTAEP